MALGTSGGIYQGSSGTFASPNTGLKLWNESGEGRFGLFNGDSTPFLSMDANGIRIEVPGVQDTIRAYRFVTADGHDEGGLYAWNGLYLGIPVRGSGLTLEAKGDGYSGEGSLVLKADWNVTISADATYGYVFVNATEMYLSCPLTVGTTTPTLNVGSAGVSTGTCSLQIGDGRTGSGFAAIDLVGDTTYSDYGLRILRGNSGANTTTQIFHRGTGNFEWVAQDAADLLFKTAATTRMTIGSTGEVAIGTTPQSGWELYVSGDIGATGVINGPLRMAGTAPATSGSSGSVGDMRFNSSYLYVCVAANSWRRVALSTF
jgi:hypothetical protein